MRYDSGGTVLPSTLWNALLMNSGSPASESSSRKRHWLYEYIPSVPFATIRTSSRVSSDFAWFAGSLGKLRKKYGLCWILIKDSKVVASSNDPTELQAIASRQGIVSPYITKIPAPSTVWRTAFGSW